MKQATGLEHKKITWNTQTVSELLSHGIQNRLKPISSVLVNTAVNIST